MHQAGLKERMAACDPGTRRARKEGPRVHRGQTSEHGREIARGSHRSIRKTLHVALTTAASSCELEAKFSFYFNEVHRR